MKIIKTILIVVLCRLCFFCTANGAAAEKNIFYLSEKENCTVKIYVLGSCSGTEPYPGRHHTAWVLEYDGNLYWFDAGETCSYTAHLMGLDLLKIKTVVISHPHLDHTGGLPNLIWTMKKIGIMNNRKEHFTLPMFIPVPEMWDNTRRILDSDASLRQFFTVDAKTVADGTIFDDGRIRIEARHNFHMDKPDAEIFRSYSFRITTADGKKIVYSGDVKSWRDMGDFTADCDVLLMETGHHAAAAVCAELKEAGCRIGDLIFIHCGREILNDPDGVGMRANKAWGKKVYIAEDASEYAL